jgi:CPA2 family monovalent cation:H+ antiporter-2
MSDVVLAVGEGVPEYLSSTAALIIAAAVIGYLSVRIRVVPIVGFLLAGVLIGPAQLGLVQNEEAVTAAAEVGVILLLFTIGIEFSIERLARVWRWIVVGGGLQVLFATAAGVGLVALFGGDWRVGVFTGFLIALSSTAIVLKIISDAGEGGTVRGRLALSVLIFQDLAVVAMVLVVPLLGAGGGEGSGGLLRALAVAAGVIAAVLLVARRVMPPLLERVAALCSPEVFLLAVIAICLGTAYVTALAGVSVSLGAFLAGLVVSESRQSTQAFAEVLPLQIIFSAVFFLSVGMLLDVRSLVANLPLVLLSAAAVLVVKTVTTALAVAPLRVGWRPAVATGLLLGQVGEFSFVLVTVGAAAGLSPGGLGEQGAQAFVATTVLLMMATPLLAAAGRRIAASAPAPAVVAGPIPTEDQHGRSDHVVLIGWGGASVELGRELRGRGVPVTMTTLNPDGAAAAEAAGLDVVRGDALHRQVLLEAGVPRARLVVVAENGGEDVTAVVAAARDLTAVPVVVRPVDAPDLDDLAALAVDHVVDPGAVSRDRLVTAALTALELPAERDGVVDTTRLVHLQWPGDAGCPHGARSRPVLPASAGCADCLRAGQRWVHLRICLECGYVGCCDSSPGQHARAHFEADGHALLVSGEPGETWGHCLLDGTTVEPRTPRPQPLAGS